MHRRVSTGQSLIELGKGPSSYTVDKKRSFLLKNAWIFDKLLLRSHKNLDQDLFLSK